MTIMCNEAFEITISVPTLIPIRRRFALYIVCKSTMMPVVHSPLMYEVKHRYVTSTVGSRLSNSTIKLLDSEVASFLSENIR
jgi:hypothetical protein